MFCNLPIYLKAPAISTTLYQVSRFIPCSGRVQEGQHDGFHPPFFSPACSTATWAIYSYRGSTIFLFWFCNSRYMTFVFIWDQKHSCRSFHGTRSIYIQGRNSINTSVTSTIVSILREPINYTAYLLKCFYLLQTLSFFFQTENDFFPDISLFLM